jgi:hypothetical protein
MQRLTVKDQVASLAIEVAFSKKKDQVLSFLNAPSGMIK